MNVLRCYFHHIYRILGKSYNFQFKEMEFECQINVCVCGGGDGCMLLSL